MKKITTLFKKDPNHLAHVINEVNPENVWVLDGHAFATRKFDGTAAAIIDGDLYKRYDVKKGKQVPSNAIPCQDPDAITGHWPHWVKCDRQRPEDKFFFEAFDNLKDKRMAPTSWWDRKFRVILRNSKSILWFYMARFYLKCLRLILKDYATGWLVSRMTLKVSSFIIG